VGWKLWGLAGALAGLGAFCGPAAALAYGLGGFWDRMRDAPWRRVLQRSLVPVTVGFVASGGYLLATPLGPEWRAALIAGAGAATLVLTRVNPLWILAAGGGAGALLY
jgi:chromate transporter